MFKSASLNPVALRPRIQGPRIDGADIADVAVIDVLVVIVLDLHDFVAGREGPAEALDLAIAGRI
jgi:hypothetical protein